MKKLALCAVAAAVAMLALPAVNGDAQPYVGLGYTRYDTEAGDIGGATGRLGYNFNRNLGVEGEATFSVDDDEAVELDQAYAGYVVGRLPVSQSFDVLGRVGYQNAQFSTPGDEVDADGLGYGVGAQWNVTPQFGVRADYTRLEGDFDTDTIGLGGVVNF